MKHSKFNRRTNAQTIIDTAITGLLWGVLILTLTGMVTLITGVMR